MFEYDNDQQFFAEVVESVKLTNRVNIQDVLPMLNFRAVTKNLVCPICDYPIWCEHMELLRSSKDTFRILAEYRCATHDNIYESITLI